MLIPPAQRKSGSLYEPLGLLYEMELLKVDGASKTVLVHAEEKYSLWVFAKNEQCYGA